MTALLPFTSETAKTSDVIGSIEYARLDVCDRVIARIAGKRRVCMVVGFASCGRRLVKIHRHKRTGWCLKPVKVGRIQIERVTAKASRVATAWTNEESELI